MASNSPLDRLLVTLDVDVQSFALCNVKRGRRLVANAVDAVMVHYVLSGTHYLTIEGFEPIACGVGCIVIIPPGLVPMISLDARPALDVFANEHTTLTREGILIMDAADGGEPDLRFVAGIVQASFSGSFGLFDTLTKPIKQHISSPLLDPAFRLLLEEVASPNLGARALTSALMKSCLVLMLRLMLSDSGSGRSMFGPLTDQRMSKALGSILDRPGAAHTIKTLADTAGMSRSSFCRAFADAFQTSPMEFVAATRLFHAAQMLKSTPLPVKVIAGNVGFTSRSHFSRSFRRAYGVDPTRFRANVDDRPIDPPAQSDLFDTAPVSALPHTGEFSMNDEPPADLDPMLRKLKLWAYLSADDQQSLMNLPFQIVDSGRNQPIVREGDRVLHCWLMLSGFCVRYKYVGDGGRQILSIHMAGDLVDLQNAMIGIADHGIQTLTECRLAKIPIAAIKQLAHSNPAISDAFWRDTLVDASIHREWVANVGRRDGPTRLAHLLCEFALKLEAIHPGEQLNYELPMTQDQLADATGLTAVHVNRVLRSLASEGLIERITPRSVLIGDWKKLAAAGDFHSEYLHLESLSKTQAN